MAISGRDEGIVSPTSSARSRVACTRRPRVVVGCASAAVLLIVVLVVLTILLASSGGGVAGRHFYHCRSDLELGPVLADKRKGLAVDDDTYLRCPASIPAVWPNTYEPLSSIRLFKAWDSNWPDAEQQASWQAVVDLVKSSNMKVLIGTQISCSEEADDADWANVKTLLQMLGPEHVMGVAIGNELELLQYKDKDIVPHSCVQRIWGGYLIRKIDEHVRELDSLSGFSHVPITSAFGGAMLSTEPFWNVPGAKVLDLFQTVIRKYGSRWVYSLNIYPYFDPSNYLDHGSTDQCSQSLSRSLCWDEPATCLFPAIVQTMRQRMRMVSKKNNVLWVTETGWSWPMSDTLKGKPLSRCADFSSERALREFYSGFLSWNMQINGSQGPDHVFYFTARDSNNFGHHEYFGLVTDCGETMCKLQAGGTPSPTRVPSPPLRPSSTPQPKPTNKAACSDNIRCLGLLGDCCPTQEGVYLGCCAEAACDAHPNCSGMWGDCCPTADGQFLWCCMS